MLTAVSAIAPLCVVGVVLTATSWWEALIVAVGLLLTLGVLKEWSLDGYPRRAVFALMFTGANWLVGALTTSSPINFVPFSLVGALLLARLRSRRLLFIGAFASGVAVLGSTSLVTHAPTWPLAGAYLGLPVIGTLFIVGVIITSEQAWLIARRLERAQETEAELAIARERVRFAGDLHDIQGHSLHVIKLKTAHAQTLVRTDLDRADVELVEIRRLVDDAIAGTRELAYARHELNLATELENAKRICEAAGIAVEVHHNAGGRSLAHPLLAQVLREATTNLLRHAQPETVSITASKTRVEIANDGVTAEPDSDLRGLARLRGRLESAGGTLRITRTPEVFALTADLTPQHADASTDHDRGQYDQR
ncbi:histidine kinase [Saccharopolyspora sp. NFXS83]|uniref:sensor histidine kinase n=1 Tax=Saccharopolyspora sp. NFXS83 TaxID=2993560 RepID=UPI00224AA6FE|nr:histidine kinase [Saccharopolyspora sp. NFXS83]MCX2731736.1 histidine kinase [Saccharopolyspora sp. NFXS83]